MRKHRRVVRLSPLDQVAEQSPGCQEEPAQSAGQERPRKPADAGRYEKPAVTPATRAVPLLPNVADADRPERWGDSPEGNDSRLLEDIPPHWSE